MLTSEELPLFTLPRCNQFGPAHLQWLLLVRTYTHTQLRVWDAASCGNTGSTCKADRLAFSTSNAAFRQLPLLRRKFSKLGVGRSWCFDFGGCWFYLYSETYRRGSLEVSCELAGSPDQVKIHEDWGYRHLKINAQLSTTLRFSPA